MDPPPSVAVAIAAIPAAIAAPDPPDEPPGVRSGFHGFRVVPNSRFEVNPSAANSGMFVLPTTIAPAARSLSTTRASLVAGSASANATDPWVVRMPATPSSQPGMTRPPPSGKLNGERRSSEESNFRPFLSAKAGS